MSTIFSGLNLDRPNNDVCEVSIFGPGIGECVVIHTGNGKWFIVDSCLCPIKKRPIALVYLESLGVDIAQDVVGLLITHWHRDHIEGAAELFERCTNAPLHLSAALREKETIELAIRYAKDQFANTDRGIREFRRILMHAMESAQTNRFQRVIASSYLFDRDIDDIRVRMIALSPSSAAFESAIVRVSKHLAKEKRTALVPESDNLNAVAVSFEFGNFSVLLGSDLEESKNPSTGWSAILNSGIVERLSIPRSGAFKIPHHGSENGHCDDVWNTLLDENPVSFTTPFTASKLPNAQRVKQICDLSSFFAVTGQSRSTKKIKRDAMVQREVKSAAISLSTLKTTMGHIRLRSDSDSKITVNYCENTVRYK